jgi:gas vesicle protein
METVLAKLEKSKDLTPEQLMAIAANENLSPEASKAFAESFSAKFNSDATKDFMEKFNQLNENRINDLKKGSDDQREFMERMMNKVLDTQSTMTGHLVNSQKDIKDEYHDRLNRTEERMDNTQDKALNYTTKDNAITRGILNSDLQIAKKECLNCKFLNDLDVNICIECGNKF